VELGPHHENISFVAIKPMRNTRLAKTHATVTMSTETSEDEDEVNGSAEGPCLSPVSDLRGLDNVRVGKYYRRGSVLFVEGQASRGVYVLCEGRAKVSISSAQGKTLVLRIAHPGDLLGINSTLTGNPYGTTVETVVRSRIDFIAREDLLRLLDRDKKACLGLAQALSRKLTGVVDHTRMLFLSNSASEKLARLLVKWCDENGKPTAQGIRINPGLTHEEMAQMICASRETVTRLFADLKRKRIVSFADNAIFIRNRKDLELAARC
jgi:CRP/FNR family transcriptional regulator